MLVRSTLLLVLIVVSAVVAVDVQLVRIWMNMRATVAGGLV